MFSSALKSLSSNISSNYTISQTPTSESGPWKIYDAKKKSSGRLASVFCLDRKSIEICTGAFCRPSSSNLRKVSEKVLERLKKEASSLARLRHPNILELVEPIEETRNGGLQFVTETVITSLSDLLRKNDIREKKECDDKASGEPDVEESGINNEKDKIELNQLEIQKGLEQISKALEFLHENVHLVHGNLTPDSILINSKHDWKVSGLCFSSPPDGSTKTSSMAPLNISEALNIDPRLPHSIQINLDYCSPDLVLDHNLNTAADMFSLGLLIITLYNFPHISPLKTSSSIVTYKRLFSSLSTIPSPSNGFLSSRPLPKDLTNSVLPRLITRWPGQRMTAKEFQESPFFNNILVATIRFLESFPTKRPNEKVQFLKGLSGVIPSFPESVLEKKIVTALLEEMKDPEFLSLILKNIFKVIDQLSSGRVYFTEKILPRMNEIFMAVSKIPSERDPLKEAGLMTVLDNIQIISENCSPNDFKDYIVPIIQLAIESPTHSIVNTSLQYLPLFLPALDFTTVKNEIFPNVASVFSKTKSLEIKIRCLEALFVLCGGSIDIKSTGTLNEVYNASKTVTPNPSSAVLDKYTMQEKVVPLLRAIKTKKPAVSLAALNVLHQIGLVADPDFIALEIFPILWTMGLGPHLDLIQFQLFMDLIRKLSNHVEKRHSRKLQQLSGSENSNAKINEAFTSSEKLISSIPGNLFDSPEIEFENLVTKRGEELKAFEFTKLDLNKTPLSASQPHGPLNTSISAWSKPNSMGSKLMTPKSNSISSTINPDLLCFETLSPITIDEKKLTQQNKNFITPLQMQPSVNANSQAISNSRIQILRPQTQSNINLSYVSSSNASSILSSTTQSSLTSLNGSFSHRPTISDIRTKSENDEQEPFKNLNIQLVNDNLPIRLESGLKNSSLFPNRTENRFTTSSIPQQKNKLQALSLQSSQIPTQSQEKVFTNELENWQSLI